jgi:cytochrome c biogenesis factor
MNQSAASQSDLHQTTEKQSQINSILQTPAVAGLLKKDNNWMDSALPWATFSAGIFGLGIMMGAAWAYESLNFGGYWAWDPVENASLVPWLVLVAGIHTCLIYRKKGTSLKATYLFFGLSFLLVLYFQSKIYMFFLILIKRFEIQ